MKKVVVSDHAILRFIERVYGLDLEPVRQKIAEKAQRAADAGAASIIIDGFKYTIEHNSPQVAIVSTVIRKGKDPYAARSRGGHDDGPDS